MSDSLSQRLRCSWASVSSRRWWLALLPVGVGVIDRFRSSGAVWHSSSGLLIAVQSIRTVLYQNLQPNRLGG